ncbi:hypothetical protein E2562_037554 [Oryza meyeriana var. granulata]|uniref:Uncharacterized protein n=1 Tax=Oryza meyeriana var. granulata TaxID=110450 RepID=A0A6G1E8H9_9ORYZ|nr:hypothetical protein E2562_037554 [Oryza meyeriana var. granulata]
MEPNVKTAFDEILKRLDSIDERCGRWEKTATDGESERKEQDAAMELRVAHLEKTAADFESEYKERDAAMELRVVHLEERESGVGHRITALE